MSSQLVRAAQAVIAASLIAGPFVPLSASAQTAVRRERAPQATDTAALRRDIESLNAAMVVAFKRDPASVAAFYTDDARIIGLGTNIGGRAAVNAYWAPLTGFTDWKLEVLDMGGSVDAPWLHGRSTLTRVGGQSMITHYLGVLRRMPDGSLKYAVDFYTSAPRQPQRGPAPGNPGAPRQ